MKIIKVLSKKVGEINYFKFILNLPKEIVKKSGLSEKSLKAKTMKGKIIIEEDK